MAISVQIDIPAPDEGPGETEAVWSGTWEFLPPAGHTFEIRGAWREGRSGGIKTYRVTGSHSIFFADDANAPGSVIIFAEEIDPDEVLPPSTVSLEEESNG